MRVQFNRYGVVNLAFLVAGLVLLGYIHGFLSALAVLLVAIAASLRWR